MATLADGHASVFTTLQYAPGNPLFPTLPDPDASPAGRFLNTPNISLLANKLPTSKRITGPHTRAARLGSLRGTHGDWYKNQWWISPRPLAFGNIVSETVIEVTVLSTFLDGLHSLQDIDIANLGDGMSVSFPSPTSLDFQEQLTVTFTAATIGDQSFDSFTTWTFDNITIEVSASGRRVILIPYIPQAPIREQLSWVTDIMKARDGTEQRHSLRLTPRQTFEYTYLQNEGTDASRLRTIMLGVQPLLFGVPIWWEAQSVTAASAAGELTINVNTDYIDQRDGGTIMIVRPDGVAFDATIDSFTSTVITTKNGLASSVPLGSLVMPVRLSYVLGNPRFNDYAADGIETTIRFETTANVDLSIAGSPETGDFPTHNGLVVFSDKNFMSGRRSRGTQEMEFQKVDNQIGVPQQYLQETFGDPMVSKGVEMYTIEEIRRWRALLHYLRGSWKAFYIPTFRSDVVPIVGFKLSDGSFTAYDTGAATFVGANDPQGSLMLELDTGEQYFADITTITDNGDGTETFSIAGNWASVSPDVTYQPSQMKISWLRLARMESDVATFVHEYVGRAQLRFMTRGVQD